MRWKRGRGAVWGGGLMMRRVKVEFTSRSERKPKNSGQAISTWTACFLFNNIGDFQLTNSGMSSSATKSVKPVFASTSVTASNFLDSVEVLSLTYDQPSSEFNSRHLLFFFFGWKIWERLK